MFNNKNTINFEDFNKWSSMLLILGCIIILICSLYHFMAKVERDTPIVQRIVVSKDLAPNSIKTYNYIDKAQADSLITALQNYDAQLTEKYQYLVEKKEQDSLVFNWCVLILSIVVSIFGWFGYKSFSTLEDRSKRIAMDNANITACDETQSYLKNNLGTLVADKSNEFFSSKVAETVKEELKGELTNIVEKKITDLKIDEQIKNLEELIETLDLKLSKIKEQNKVEKAAQEMRKLTENKTSMSKNNNMEESKNE